MLLKSPCCQPLFEQFWRLFQRFGVLRDGEEGETKGPEAFWEAFREGEGESQDQAARPRA